MWKTCPMIKCKSKGKSFSIRVLDIPLRLQKVTLPEFLDNRHMKVVRLSALCIDRVYLPPPPSRGFIPCTHICYRLLDVCLCYRFKNLSCILLWVKKVKRHAVREVCWNGSRLPWTVSGVSIMKLLLSLFRLGCYVYFSLCSRYAELVVMYALPLIVRFERPVKQNVRVFSK